MLNGEGRLSQTSYEILQPLISNGLSLVVATGRTRDNAVGAFQPLKLTLPIITDNGTFVYDAVNNKFLSKKIISDELAKQSMDLIRKYRVSPYINTLDGESINVYYGDFTNEAQEIYYTKRSSYGLSGYIKDTSYTQFSQHTVFNFSMLETKENLIALYEEFLKIENLTTVMFPAEYFDGYYWLEILPSNSGKGQALDFLKETYKPKKIVCFGDNLNDLCMFERADVKVVPSNAVPEVLEIADIIIGPCTQDSVAKYIEEDFKAN